MPISTAAITPSRVVRLDTTVLRALGGSTTNAEIGADGDRAVTGVHNFLVVQVTGTPPVCTAVPLFPKSAVGNQPLVERLKSGAADGWIGTDVYFSRWQHWRIPLDSFLQAMIVPGDAADDASVSPSRYAAGDSSALDDIRIWESRNRAPYRAV